MVNEPSFRGGARLVRDRVGATHVLALGRFSTERGPHASDALIIERDSLVARALPLTLRGPRGRGWVDAAAFHGDRLVIAGEFTHVNGVERDKVAEIALDGRVTDWAPKLVFTGASPFVEAIAVHEGVVAFGGGLVVNDVDPPVLHVLRFGRRAPT